MAQPTKFWLATALLVGTLTLVGCGAEEDTSDPIDGRFRVADGRELALRCVGEGTPTIIFDAGSGAAGISVFEHSPIVGKLARETRVCVYDRAGLGSSDPAPVRKRGLDDAADDLHTLLEAADVPGPYVLVGSSGGGFNVYHHAGRFPDDVVGLVMLDVPAGQANIPASEIPSWDDPSNPEHMDYVTIERQMALDRLPIPEIPVTVVTARGGQSADPSEQKVWLEGSAAPVHLVLEGGHEIYEDDPEGVFTAIRRVLLRSE